MFEVMLVLGQPTFTPRKLFLADTGIMGGLFHLRITAQDIPLCHHSVRIIWLVILVFLHLLLVVVMVKVVLVLVRPTLPPRKLIVAFLVVILCHLGVGILHP